MAATAQGGGTVTAVVAASLIMVTPQRLRQLVAEGFVPKPKGRDAYSLVGVVQGYINFLKAEERRTTKSASASRVADNRADEIQQRMEAKDKVLLKEAIAGARAVLDEAAGGLKADLLSIPARVTKDIPLRRKIETEIDDAFRAAAQRAELAASAELATGDTMDAGGETGARPVGRQKSNVPAKRGRSRAS